MKVVMISGKSGSGKDTLANFMNELLIAENKRVIIIHYADCVKFYAKQYMGWDGEKDEYGRSLLQNLGTNWVRAKYPNYWADLVGQFLNAVDDQFDVALIPDLRFCNEEHRVKKFNKDCVTIRINKLTEDGDYILNPNLTPKQHKHPSECDMDDVAFDIMINNCDTLEDLKEDAKEVIKMIGV